MFATIRETYYDADKARSLVRHVAPQIAVDGQAPACACRHALDHALITAPEVRDPAVMARLDAVAGRVLGAVKAG